MTGGCAPLDMVEASLRRRFRVVQTAVSIGGQSLSLLHPASAEELINEADFERDERLPYWAELWPSSRFLAARVLEEDGAGRSLLDLGCGAGLVATCAAAAGFDVTASDYYDDAIRFTRVNVWRNTARDARGIVLDWRHLRDDLGRYNRVVASDVLYERPYGTLVARVIDATLATDGVAVVADPGRVGRDDFTREVKRAGLEVTAQNETAYVDGHIRQTITVYEIRRRTPTS